MQHGEEPAAGGVADVTGRPTAIALEKVFKQPVAVSNRPARVSRPSVLSNSNSLPLMLLFLLLSVLMVSFLFRSCSRTASAGTNREPYSGCNVPACWRW